MSQRTIEPHRIRLPEDKSEASTALQDALFGPVATRGERTPIAGTDDGMFDTFVLIEAARKKDIALLFEGFEVEHCCLFNGAAADNFALQAPYLAKVDPDSDFAAWLIDEAWGKGFAVFLRSNNTMETLRAQFRKITQIYDSEHGSWYNFRFYAPEVVRRTLPALPPKDFSEIAQGIPAFITESADARSIYVV